MNDMAINRLQECELIIENGLYTFYEVGNALTEIRDSKLYKEGYSTFDNYCVDRWGIKRAHAYRLMQTSDVISRLSPIGDTLPQSESQAREIAKAPTEDQADVWQQAQEETGKEQPTAQEIKEIVSTGSLHVSQGNNDWYTPSRYVESARAVMNGIDLDPASSDIAQKTVNAGEYCTIDDSGLDRPFWMGKVWLNPPYSHPEVEQFTDKLIENYVDNNVSHAVVLVNNATDTKWFHGLLSNCSSFCILKGRISFIDVTGKIGLAARQGQFFFYFGGNSEAFKQEFSSYGQVVKL